MKQWIKKWWFSIVMFIFALIILIYGIVVLCLGEIELFYQGGILASYSIMTLIVLLIGLANVPKKENK
jgi:uncharacterized ion transporter superfamily protein YfcC